MTLATMVNSICSLAEAYPGHYIVELVRQLDDPQEELSSLTEEIKEAIINAAIDDLHYGIAIGCTMSG